MKKKVQEGPDVMNSDRECAHMLQWMYALLLLADESKGSAGACASPSPYTQEEDEEEAEGETESRGHDDACMQRNTLATTSSVA